MHIYIYNLENILTFDFLNFIFHNTVYFILWNLVTFSINSDQTRKQ